MQRAEKQIRREINMAVRLPFAMKDLHVPGMKLKKKMLIEIN